MSEYMRVIDTDPDLLRRSAEAATHAADATWTHIQGEIKAADGDLEALMGTLRAEGPYGYTIIPEIYPDGTVRAPIITTREGIREAYGFVRGRSDLLTAEPILEIRGLWYVFNENFTTGRDRSTGEVSSGHRVLGLFPSGRDEGIVGELVWPRMPGEVKLGRNGSRPPRNPDPTLARLDLLRLHDRFLDAFRSGDVDALLETMNEDVQGGVRDYLTDSGAAVELRSHEGVREHYEALFERYQISGIDLLDRVVQDWYVFAEFRVTANDRTTGLDVGFNLAEFCVTSDDGLLFVRIGFGTDVAPLA